MKYTVKYYQVNPANNRETYHNSKIEAMAEMRRNETNSKLFDQAGDILAYRDSGEHKRVRKM